jgi:hypothetical protein
MSRKISWNICRAMATSAIWVAQALGVVHILVSGKATTTPSKREHSWHNSKICRMST